MCLWWEVIYQRNWSDLCVVLHVTLCFSLQYSVIRVTDSDRLLAGDGDVVSVLIKYQSESYITSQGQEYGLLESPD